MEDDFKSIQKFQIPISKNYLISNFIIFQSWSGCINPNLKNIYWVSKPFLGWVTIGMK